MKSALEVLAVFVVSWRFQFPTGVGLSVRNVTIPRYGMMGGSALLSCEFSLLPSDKLLFLKWYKNGEEFYRFTPASDQPILTFPAEGVVVELSRSNFNQLVLRNLTLSTGGLYKCEAMAEGTFQAPYGTGLMTIIAPPETIPAIVGVRPLVSAGDRVVGTCTSYRSKPAAALTLYVDGVALEHADFNESEPILEPNGLETSVLEFNFVAERHHFKKGFMDLRCTATILNLYWVNSLNVSEINVNAQPSHTGRTFLPSSAVSVLTPAQRFLMLSTILFELIWETEVMTT